MIAVSCLSAIFIYPKVGGTVYQPVVREVTAGRQRHLSRGNPVWRGIRIAVLLFILATVAQGAWLARSRTAAWNNTLRVVIYPVNADGSQASAQYISELHQAAFVPIETFFKEEGRNYAVQLSMPVEVSIAPAVSSRPPAAPAGGGKPEALLWSLRLRYWAYWND